MMQKLSNQLPNTFNQGWSIQIYGGDRRLLCSLNPSHAWAWVIGAGLGFLVAIASLPGERPHQASPSGKPTNEAPLAID